MTPRQTQVAHLAAEGLGYRQIGERLGIAPRTAEQHIRDIAARLPDERSGSPLRRVMRYMLAGHRGAA
jgi:DNA-binding CsgD family transcriptional regulator